MPVMWRWRFPAALLLVGAGLRADQQAPRLLDRVEVSRVVIDARIVDGSGRAVRGLRPEHFRVEVDGQPIPLASVDWIGRDDDRDRRPSPAAPAAYRPEGDDVPDGRLVVFLFQKDLAGSRMPGFLKMRTRLAELVDDLGPADRAAVLVFDSHLRPHLDFTGDRDRVRHVLLERALFEWPKPVEPGPAPSLLAHLDRDAARRAATAETALLVIARALQPLRGAKSVVLVGWGLGRLAGGIFAMESDYDEARRALGRARATVFSLDITEADAHTLELGLKQVAEDTGGFYVRAYTTPGAAVDRIAHALSGYYVLSFDKPPGRAGSHRVSVALVGRKGTVLARTGYVD